MPISYLVFMIPAVNEITKSIIGKDSLSDCTLEDLQKVTGQYPYFGPAQLLLTRKLRDQKSLLADEQQQKASLFFQNPLWLDFLIHSNSTTESLDIESASNYVGESFTPLAEPLNIQPGSNEVGESSTARIKDEIHEPVQSSEIKTGEFEFKNVEPASIEAKEPEISTASAPTIFETPATVEEVVDQTSPFEADNVEVDDESMEHEGSSDNKIEVAIPQFKFQPIDPSKAALTFEPYHTVDYFASQGIKPKEEEKSKDRFTLQLKSFTEWLKVMKRIPASEVGASVTASEEKKVEQLAEVSINDREVVTEAMAEVWEKQGNHAKALETYEKLSLLNPAKSSYFAAKIENLKTL